LLKFDLVSLKSSGYIGSTWTECPAYIFIVYPVSNLLETYYAVTVMKRPRWWPNRPIPLLLTLITMNSRKQSLTNFCQ